jgi:hypothetical protein
MEEGGFVSAAARLVDKEGITTIAYELQARKSGDVSEFLFERRMPETCGRAHRSTTVSTPSHIPVGCLLLSLPSNRAPKSLSPLFTSLLPPSTTSCFLLETPLTPRALLKTMTRCRLTVSLSSRSSMS